MKTICVKCTKKGPETLGEGLELVNNKKWIVTRRFILCKDCVDLILNEWYDRAELFKDDILDAQYEELLKTNCYTEDQERNHEEADKILLQALGQLGLVKTADAFNDIGKWYA